MSGGVRSAAFPGATLLLAIGAWLTVAAVAHSAALRAELTPIAPRPRSAAPLLVDVKLHWRGAGLLEGTLEVLVDGDDQPILRQRTQELALTTGSQTVRLMLPPLASRGRDSTLDARLHFHGRKEIYDLGRFPISTPLFGTRGFTIAVCGAPARTPEGEPRLWQALRLDRFEPPTGFAMERLVTTPVTFEPGELPATAAGFCPFDVVLLEGRSLGQLRERQLSALAGWTEAGGSLCIVPGGILNDEQVRFLNRLAAPVSTEPPFRLDDAGRLTSARGAMIFARPELGRLVVAMQRPQTAAESDTPAWRRAATFLWKFSGRRAETAESEGKWNGRFDPRISEAGNADPARHLAIEAYLRVLLPQSSRLIPWPVVGVILGTFILLVGPGDWLVLGWLRRRRWTWITFPVAAAGCTALTVLAAEHYLGSEDHRMNVIFADVGRAGRVLRESRFELLFAARDREVVTDLRQSLCVPTSFTRHAFRDYRVQEPGPQALLTVEGSMPARWQMRQALRQWTPQLNRTLSLEASPDPSGLRWDAITAAELAGARRPAEFCAERAGQPGCHFVVIHHGLVKGYTPLDPTVPEFVRVLSLMPPTGFGALISQTSPTGSSDLDDLPLNDGFDSQQWIVVAIQPGPGEVRISRRIYRTDE